MIRKELGKIWQNKLLLVTVMVVCLIPALYAGFFLKSIWNPYENLDQLAVAVVNEDEAVEYNGETLNVGAEVVETLEKDTTFGWEFVSAAEAEEGMENNKYYMVVTIPNDFSANAASVTEVEPEQMNITYETNGSLNYPVESVATAAMAQIKAKVATSVSEAYANSLVASINEAGEGLQEAADGADELTNGLSSAHEGTGELAASTPTLSSGVSELDSGAASLAAGVEELVSQVQESGATLSASLPELEQLKTGAESLATNLGSSSGAVGNLQTQLTDLITYAAQTGAISVAEAQALGQQIAALASGLSSAATGAQQVAAGVEQTYNQLVAMSGQLNSAETVASLGALTAGAEQLSAGLSSLSSKVPALTSGISALDSGVGELEAGSETLASALQDGATTINGANLTEATVEQVGDPVTVTEDKYTDVKGYGHGLAPYFMAVSIFIGCMVFNYIYPLRKIADRKGSWSGWWASKVLVAAASAGTMAVVLGAVMMAIGLEVQNVPLYFAILILYANACMFLCLPLVLGFDNPGRFAAMCVLIVSLGAAGGTFPVETADGFYQVVHNFVPITYALAGLRSAISGGISETSVAGAFAALAIMIVVGVVCAAIAAYALKKKHGLRAHQSRTDNKDELLCDDYSNFSFEKFKAEL